MTTNERTNLLTLDQAADVLSVSTRFVRRAVHDGHLGAVRIRRVLRFHPDDIATYVDAHRIFGSSQPHGPTPDLAETRG